MEVAIGDPMKRSSAPPEDERRAHLEQQLAHLVDHATEVLGSREKALRWLHAPNGALSGATPNSMLSEVSGIEAVEAVLVRIEHGVFS